MTTTQPQVFDVSPGVLPDAWHGVEEWEPVDGRWRPWRLPATHPGLVHAPELARTARMAAGVRARIRTDAAALRLTIHADGDEVSPVDVRVDGALLVRRELPRGVHDITVDLPAGTADVEVWLPQHGEVTIGACRLADATTAEPAGTTGLRWVTYGSSITQCKRSHGPSETWPARVARRYGWRLRCLGFGGQCHLDPVAAEAIRSAPADLISMCLGINIYGLASFGARALAPQLSGFVERVRDAHPDVPIVVVSPLVAPDRERTANAAGLTLQDVRRTVEDVVNVLRDAGDHRLELVDGPSVLGDDDTHLLDTDQLHPTALGDEHIAERLGPLLHAAAKWDQPGDDADD